MTRKSRDGPLVLVFMLLPVFLAILYGCGPQRKHFRQGKNPAGIGRTIENTTLPDGAMGTVSGSLSPLADSAAGSYIAYVQGFRGTAVAVAAGENFTLTGVPVGERDIIIAEPSDRSKMTLNLTAEHLAGRIPAVSVLEGKTSDIGAITLSPTGTVRGTVIGATPSGTYAFIPGSWFITEVDAAGNYVLQGVPAGSYRITVQRPNYVKGYTGNIDVASATDVTAAPVTLATKLPPEGAIALDQGAEFAPSRTVLVDISQEPAANKIMLSESPQFTGASWQKITESVEYTFAADGPATLYAKFLKEDIYETSPVQGQIYVNAGVPTGTLAVQNGERYTAVRPITLVISGHDPMGITSMMISEDKAFKNAAWEPYATSRAWTLSQDDGEKTLYLKLRNGAGHDSAVITDTIGYDTKQPLSPAISVVEGAFVGSTTISLALAAQSAVAPIASVMLSEKSDLAGAPWQPFAAKMSFSLSSSEGVKTIYARFKDGAGNTSGIVSTVTTLDTTAPTTPVISNTARRIDAATTSERIVISTPSSDTNFKGYEARGGTYSDWTELSDPITFALPAVDSWYTLEIRGKDQAGNTSGSAKVRVFHGTRTILEGSVANLTEESSRLASSPAVTLPATYSPYLIKGKSGGTTFNDYNLVIDGGSELDIDAGVSVSVANLTVGGIKSAQVSMISAKASPASGDWRSLNLSGRVNLTYLNVMHNGYTTLMSSVTSASVINSSFTQFRSYGIQDFSGGNIALTNVSILCSATAKGYYLSGITGSNHILTDSVLQGCTQGLLLEGSVSLTMHGSNLLANTINAYVVSETTGSIDFQDNYFETGSTTSCYELGVRNASGIEPDCANPAAVANPSAGQP